MQSQQLSEAVGLAAFVPPVGNPQTDIPRIAKDSKLVGLIEKAVSRIPTAHILNFGDARRMSELQAASIHLVVTSPPYWTPKEYRDSEGQMGHIEDYEDFLAELDKVWRHCFRALVPDGGLICVVGDVCLPRRKNNGRRQGSRRRPTPAMRVPRCTHAPLTLPGSSRRRAPAKRRGAACGFTRPRA